jgi:hypothetical protein
MFAPFAACLYLFALPYSHSVLTARAGANQQLAPASEDGGVDNLLIRSLY